MGPAKQIAQENIELRQRHRFLPILLAISCLIFWPIVSFASDDNPKEHLSFFQPIKISIYIPIEKPELFENTMDATSLMKASPAFSQQLEVLRRHKPVGTLGKYDGVFEVLLGFEGFTPQAGSNPTLGEADVAEITPSLQMIVYSEPSVTQAELDSYILDVLASHPWEHPVIEIYKDGTIHLWSPESNE